MGQVLTEQVCVCVSGYSTGVEQMGAELGFSSEIGTLGLSLYVVSGHLAHRIRLTRRSSDLLLVSATRSPLDVADKAGPMILAPLSEYFGRRNVYLVSWFIFTCFQIPLALAQNTATVMICRFIQGFAGSAPLSNTGGVVHDLFGIDECGMAVGIYALSSADGPPFGNVVSGYIAQQKGWRWLFWVYVRRMLKARKVCGAEDSG